MASVLQWIPGASANKAADGVGDQESSTLSAITHHPMRYYSQHGEDYLLEKMLESQASGIFVEIGCIDSLRFFKLSFCIGIQ